MDTKICPRCKIEKPKSDYYKDSSKSDKLFYCCKSCDEEYNSSCFATKIPNTNWRKNQKALKQNNFFMKMNNQRLISLHD